MASPPPPDGYKPPEGCTICPPGGVYLEGGAACVDPVIDSRQTYSLFKHGQVWFGSFMVFFIALTLFFQVANWMSFKGKFPLTEMRLSVRQGMVTSPIMRFFDAERMFEAPGTGFVGAYGMILSDNLSPVDAASAIAGLMMSAINLGKMCDEFHHTLSFESDYDVEVLGARAVANLRFPMFVLVMKMVWTLTALGLISSFAIVSHALHPSLACLVGFITTLAGNLLSGTDLLTSLAQGAIPSFWFQTWNSSAFGFKKSDFKANFRYLYIMFLMRTLIVIALCSLSLPDGIIKFGTLGRPMGREIFDAEFIRPATIILSLNMDGADHMSLGTVCFRAFALLGFVVGTGAEILFAMYALLFLPNFCDGVADEELISAARHKSRDIDAWVMARNRAYEACTLEP